MSSEQYDIHLDDKYGSLTLVDIPAEIAAHEPWFNQTLTTVNESVVRLGVIEGDFHWHHHDDQDEFFLVLEGRLLIDLEDRDTVTLDPHQGYTVPQGRRAPHARAGSHRDPDGRVGRGGAHRRLTAAPPGTTGPACRRAGAASAGARGSPGSAARAAPRTAASGRARRGGRPRARPRSQERARARAAAAS